MLSATNEITIDDVDYFEVTSIEVDFSNDMTVLDRISIIADENNVSIDQILIQAAKYYLFDD